MGKFLDSIPEQFRNPTTFPALRMTADLPDFSPQHVSVIGMCLGSALSCGSDLNLGGRTLVWPEDHGMHQRVANEWYFLVSNLSVAGSEDRIALVTVPMRHTAAPPTLRYELGWSDLDAQVIDSNVKLTIVGGDGEVTNVLRPVNVQSGLSGDLALSTTPFAAAIGPDELAGAADEPYPMRTHYKGPYLTIDLEHARGASYFFQGDHGYIPTSATNPAGYLYYSAPQIRTTGTIVYLGVTYDVSGVSWFDHQWGTAAPTPPDPSSTTSGWIWFGFNFDDGSAVTFMAPHDTAAPDPDKFNGFGTYVPPTTADSIPPPAGPVDGTLIAGQVTITDHMVSPVTGATWPCGWEFAVADAVGGGSPFTIVATPWAKDQLGMFASLQEFWEGGADLVRTNPDGVTIKGRGFCESVGFEPFANYWKRVLAFFGMPEGPARR
jgi:predicted secreted hydrolase